MAGALLARAGWSVTVLEQASVAGGAVRSEALTIPGYVHDTFSAFYGLLHYSPVFRQLELDRRVQWASFATPVGAAVSPDDAAVCHADIERTVAGLASARSAGAERASTGPAGTGPAGTGSAGTGSASAGRASRHGQDGAAWADLCRWWGGTGRRLFDVLLRPIPSLGPTARLLGTVPPRAALDLGRMMLAPVAASARERLSAPAAQALLAAGASHSDLAVDQAGSMPGALMLAMVAQHIGMPVPVGGAGRLADALVESVRAAGGTVVTGQQVVRVIVAKGRAVGVETATGLSLSARRAVLADAGPLRLFRDLVGEERIPAAYLAGLRRFRYGSGIFKLDLALDGPVRWQAEDLDGCGVIHLTGDLDAMARAGAQVRQRLIPAEPMLIVGQQSCADPTRAPAGGHTLWVETHVPPRPIGDAADAIAGGPWSEVSAAFTDRVLDRLARHAPSLPASIVGHAVHTPPDLEAANPNLVGGDLGGGSMALDQQAVFRPVPGWFRYATPVRGLYLCSASAHPGGGVHGMVGRNCAHRVLADARIRRI